MMSQIASSPPTNGRALRTFVAVIIICLGGLAGYGSQLTQSMQNHVNRQADLRAPSGGSQASIVAAPSPQVSSSIAESARVLFLQAIKANALLAWLSLFSSVVGIVVMGGSLSFRLLIGFLSISLLFVPKLLMPLV